MDIMQIPRQSPQPTPSPSVPPTHSFPDAFLRTAAAAANVATTITACYSSPPRLAPCVTANTTCTTSHGVAQAHGRDNWVCAVKQDMFRVHSYSEHFENSHRRGEERPSRRLIKKIIYAAERGKGHSLLHRSMTAAAKIHGQIYALSQR